MTPPPTLVTNPSVTDDVFDGGMAAAFVVVGFAIFVDVTPTVIIDPLDVANSTNLKDFRFHFDQQLYQYLSQALLDGQLREFQYTYPRRIYCVGSVRWRQCWRLCSIHSANSGCQFSKIFVDSHELI